LSGQLSRPSRLCHLALALFLWACAPLLPAQSLSLTFDDGLNPEAQPEAALWNARILEGLREARVTSMIFPALVRVGGPAGLALVADWARAGHAVGNHTSRHRSLGSPQLTLAEFITDVTEADTALRPLPGFTPRLRFPFLKEGNTAEKRDGFRTWMKANGYAPAPISIDASDWYYDQVYRTWVGQHNTARAEAVRRAYIAHLLDRAGYYDALARRLLGRSPHHVLLLHTNAINAATLGELIAAFRARGWTLQDPLQAFRDPLYDLQPDTLPAGESIVWSLAKSRGEAGLRYPAEDSVYEEPILRAQGLLP
jgi:peptidoglycan/xylan/chitin deacetylase (PgdA/CDA1 family)